MQYHSVTQVMPISLSAINTAEEAYRQALAFQNFSNPSANKNTGKPIAFVPTPPCETSFESDYFDNPDLPTPQPTPFQNYKEDPELSSTLPMMKYENDESYGIIEYKDIYSNNNGNQISTAYDKSVVPLDLDISFDIDPTGNLIEPLHNHQYINQSILPSSTTSRKRKNPNTDARESPIRRFGCRYPGCNRAFARLYNLKTHQGTHDPNRERPYGCSQCPKTFARKHDMQRHERSVHRGERMYTCGRCQRQFSRKDALQRHHAVNGCADEEQNAQILGCKDAADAAANY